MILLPLPVSIRRFVRGDAAAVARMARAAHEVTLARVYPKAVIRASRVLSTASSFRKRCFDRALWVACAGERIVGVIGLKGGEVKHFFVHPVFQGRGVGRRLYAAVERSARRRGLRVLTLQSSLYAVPIYRRLGFRSVRKGYERLEGVRVEMVFMRKKLA